MREVVTHFWCDPCWHEGEDRGEEVRVPADSTEAMTIGGMAREMDFCVEHKKTLVTPLADALAKHGRPLAGKGGLALVLSAKPEAGAPVQEWTCPLCPPDAQTLRRSSAVQHVWGKHRVGQERPSMLTICPDPTCDFGEDKPTTTQGVAMHRMKIHDYDPLAEALEGLV